MTIFPGSTCTRSRSEVVFFSCIHFIVASNVPLNHKSTCFFDPTGTTENPLSIESWAMQYMPGIAEFQYLWWWQSNDTKLTFKVNYESVGWTYLSKQTNKKPDNQNTNKKPVWNVPSMCRALSIFTSSSHGSFMLLHRVYLLGAKLQWLEI